MNKSGFDKLYWGFLFIMIDFKIMGFDILPDIIGYILFAVGLSILSGQSSYFKKAGLFNIPMIVLSIFSIYQPDAQTNTQTSGINLGVLGIFGILLAIASTVFSIVTVYYLFLGIKDMANIRGRYDITEEADKNWRNYIYFQLAVLLSFIIIFIPLLGFGYVIALLVFSVVLTVILMKFMRLCGDNLV